MNSAEYRTLREACGLSQQAAADFHQVAVRTIAHWETGRNSVPSGAAAEMQGLNARLERAVIQAVDLYTDEGGGADVVKLARYRSPDSYAGSRADREGLLWPCHNALIGRSKLALERIGARVEIAWA